MLILDGFGRRDAIDDNAIAAAHSPVWDELWKTYPHTELNCSGTSVGLPEHQMGNSEVGHLHLGCGRILNQDLSRINKAIEDKTFFSNPVLCEAVDTALENDKCLHIVGMLSPGGVHSHEKHLHAMIELAAKRGLANVIVHGFLDGRDMPPKSAAKSIELMEDKFKEFGSGRIGTLVGRYYAMDRDNRWRRIQRAYELIVQGKSEYMATSAMTALEQAYERGETDEFVRATQIVPTGTKLVKIIEGDVVLYMNFRADRARAFSRALTESLFSEFYRGTITKLGGFVTLTKYDKNFMCPVAFPSTKLANCLGEVLSNIGLRQLRLAETEKYAHVTYFFNGGRERPFEGEIRKLIPSPNVRTYDLKPEMSAPEVTAELINAIEGGEYDVIICNYANCDMVGHTGIFHAAIKSVETIDRCLGLVLDSLKRVGGELLLTADHGNVEQMLNRETGQPQTAHTGNRVPLIYVGRPKQLANGGALSDVSPTLLDMMEIEKPKDMTGRSLLV